MKEEIKTTNVIIVVNLSYRANNLKEHILIVHKGHKDRKCVSCSKSFSTAVSLKNHIVLKQDI